MILTLWVAGHEYFYEIFTPGYGRVLMAVDGEDMLIFEMMLQDLRTSNCASKACSDKGSFGHEADKVVRSSEAHCISAAIQNLSVVIAF